MKKTAFTIFLILVFLVGAAYSITLNQNSKKGAFMDKKVLVAYFSLSGNTKFVAQKIKDKLNADIYEIKTVKKYPNSYNETVEIAKEEIQKNIPVEIEKPIDITPYDVIFIGTPAWWYTMAPAVKTFILNNNFEGKIIIPFVTHGGGGGYKIKEEMHQYAKNATVKEGFVVYSRGNSSLDNEIDKWLLKIK